MTGPAALAVAVALALSPGESSAGDSLHRCDDPGGKMVFTNIDTGRSGCRESIRTPGRKAAKAPAASKGKVSAAKRKSYPKVSNATQQERDRTRRQILQDELESEIGMARAFSKRIEEGNLSEENLGILRRNREDHVLNIQALRKELAALR